MENCKCMYCGFKKECGKDEFDAFCCDVCKKNIQEKVDSFIEKRCPVCIEQNNLADCKDKKCINYVSELFTGRLPTELRIYLNVKLQDNPEELLRHHIKSIMLIAEAIYKQGIKDGESYQFMSNQIQNNKLH